MMMEMGKTLISGSAGVVMGWRYDVNTIVVVSRFHPGCPAISTRVPDLVAGGSGVVVVVVVVRTTMSVTGRPPPAARGEQGVQHEMSEEGQQRPQSVLSGQQAEGAQSGAQAQQRSHHQHHHAGIPGPGRG
jgi:hypothetical protein